MNPLLEMLEWIDLKTAPNEQFAYSRCPICDATWWDKKESHNLSCFVPRLRNLAWDLTSNPQVGGVVTKRIPVVIQGCWVKEQ